MQTYPNLSKPIQIGKVTIKNRMIMAPMDTGFGNNTWGGFTKEGAWSISCVGPRAALACCSAAALPQTTRIGKSPRLSFKKGCHCGRRPCRL